MILTVGAGPCACPAPDAGYPGSADMSPPGQGNHGGIAPTICSGSQASAWEPGLGSSGFRCHGKPELASPHSQAGAWEREASVAGFSLLSLSAWGLIPRRNAAFPGRNLWTSNSIKIRRLYGGGVKWKKIWSDPIRYPV